MNTIKDFHIILPEIQNFCRDTGYKIEETDQSKLKTFYKLFCIRHSDSVWFNEGKLFKVNFVDGKINVFESKPVGYLTGANEGWPKNLFWIFILILAYFLSNTPYFYLILVIAVAFAARDSMQNLLYRLRISFFHR